MQGDRWRRRYLETLPEISAGDICDIITMMGKSRIRDDFLHKVVASGLLTSKQAGFAWDLNCIGLTEE